MNLKTIGFSAAILAFGMGAGFLIRGALGTGQLHNSLETGSTQHKSLEIADSVANEAAVPGKSGHTVERSENLLTNSDATSQEGQELSVESPDGESSGHDLDLQETLIQGNSLDTAALTPGLEDDETFARLMSQLREDTSPIAANMRMEYQLELYSQPLARNGTVTLDTFDCGERLCAVELRAPDPAKLGEFVRTLTNSEHFEPRAMVALMAKPNPATAGSQVMRVIFSHDPSVSSISIPRSVLESKD